MKKYILITLLAAALVTPARAQSATKVLVVDVSKVLLGFNEAQSEQMKFQASVDKVNDEIRKLLENGQTLQKQYSDYYTGANNPGLSPEGRNVFNQQLEAKKKELTDLDAKLTEFRNSSAKILQDQQTQIVNNEVNKIKDAVKQIAGHYGANLVLNNSSIATVVYSEGTMDITTEVIDTLNRASPVSSPTSGAAAGAMAPNATSGNSTAPRSTAPALTLPPIGQ